MNNNDHNVGLQLSANEVPESVNRADQALVEWFALHEGVWSGTAAELLAAVKTEVAASNDLWPRSPGALYAHIESDQEILYSLGLRVLLSSGHPRMISIRSSRQDEPPETKPWLGPPVSNEISRQEAPMVQSIPDEGQPESVSDNTAETLIAMLKTSATSESNRPGTISKLAAAPAHLRTAFKRAWMKRPRAV